MIEKARQDLETNITSLGKSEWTIEAKPTWVPQGEPRGERDVIRLPNSTEDKRAFRRMLTSADPFCEFRDWSDDIYIQAFLTETLDGWRMGFKTNDCTFHPIPRKIDNYILKNS